MTIRRRIWLIFLISAAASLAVWLKFTYPSFSFAKLSVDRPAARAAAQTYLKERGVDPSSYRSATVFTGASFSDQYLQKALGFEGELNFLREHHFELFFWKVRFFRENEKEEYHVTVSAATGEVLGALHEISESDARPDVGEEAARQTAIDWLTQRFPFNPDEYLLHSHLTKKYDNRLEYAFTWEKKDVFIRWDDAQDSGGAKLLTGARVSGDEVLSFNHNYIDIPDQFIRYIEGEKNVGRNLAILFRAVFYALLTASIFYVVVRRNNLVMHTVKHFCVALTAALFVVHVVSYFNEFENVLYAYPTTADLASYLWQGIMMLLMDTFIVTVAILMPALAGESLHYEEFPERKEGSFLHYITSGFLTRPAAGLVVLGYFSAVIMIGIQSAAFTVGQKFLGVWVEHTWMAQLSASYWPFLGALVIGASASFSEEIAFRLFGISLGKKIFKNTLIAVVVFSIFWGYGHSTYMVFPMWFRGLEVTCLGLFLSGVYLRFGIIPVITAHFLFDVFWSSSAYLLGDTTPGLFYSSLAVLLIPAVFGLLACLRNQPPTERPMQWRLNKHQLYNLAILRNYLESTRLWEGRQEADLKQEIVAHGWDIAVVEFALKAIKEKKGGNAPEREGH